MHLWALRTDVDRWKHEFQHALDSVLVNANVRLIDIDWSQCAVLKRDADHFTWRGFVTFSQLFANALSLSGINDVYILADSTIGYWNHDGRAEFQLREDLSRQGVTFCGLSAVNGCGFVAAPAFRLPCDSGVEHVVFVGGWNDIRHDFGRVTRRIQHLAKRSNRLSV